MANQEENKQPIEKIPIGSVTLLKWENTSRKGKKFHSYSIVKKVTVFNDKDKTKFTGQIMAVNLLNRYDLRDIKQAITKMQDNEEGAE